MTITKTNVLHGHVSEDTAYLVDDYPYGFKLRTQIRYWIETTKHGDRMVSQTLNPKTGRWNKPKKTTYVKVAALYLNDDGHVKWAGIDIWTDAAVRDAFLAVMDGHLSDAQKDRLAEILGVNKAFEGVTFSIHEGPFTDEQKQEQAKIEAIVQQRVRYETANARTQLDGGSQQ